MSAGQVSLAPSATIDSLERYDFFRFDTDKDYVVRILVQKEKAPGASAYATIVPKGRSNHTYGVNSNEPIVRLMVTHSEVAHEANRPDVTIFPCHLCKIRPVKAHP